MLVFRPETPAAFAPAGRALRQHWIRRRHAFGDILRIVLEQFAGRRGEKLLFFGQELRPVRRRKE